VAAATQPYPLLTKLLGFIGLGHRVHTNPHEIGPELQLTIDTIPVLVARHRADGVREYGNKQLRDYLGPGVAIEDTAAIIHPDDIARVNEVWRIHVASGVPSETEQRMRRVDGEYRWHLVRRAPLRDENGEVIKWYAVGIDIEDKKRAEAALRQSEAQLAAAKRQLEATIDTIPALVASYEPDGSRDFVNRPWRDYTGISQEEAKGKSWSITVHPDDFAAGQREWQACLAASRPFQMDQRFRRADGEYRWHMSRRVPLRDDNGNVRKWYGVGFDIEEKKRAESALRRSEAYLAEAQRLSHTGSFGWDIVGGEIFWSEQTFRIFEYDQGAKPSAAMVLQRVHPDDIAVVRKAMDRATKELQAFDIEHRLLMPDGRVKHLHVVAHAVTDEPDRPHFIGAVMDITARKTTEEALRRSEHRYRTLFQAMAASFWECDFSRVNEMLRGLRKAGIADFRRYFEENPDFIRQMLQATRIVDVNDQTVALFGRGSKQELLTSAEPFWPQESWPDYAEAVLSGIAGHTMFSTETRMRRLDGSLLDVHFTACNPTEARREGMVLVGIIDITARKQAFAALEQSEQRYRRLFDHMPVAMLQFDAHERNRLLAELRAKGVTDLNAYLDANPEVERQVRDATSLELANERMIQLLGARDASELAGPTSRFWGASPDTFRRSLVSRFRGEPSFQEETKVTTLEDRVVDVLCTISRREDIGKTLLSFVDITDRVRAQEALRQSEQRYRHLFQYMPIALWQLNAGNVVELFKGLRAQGVAELGPYLDRHPDFLRQLMDALVVEEVNERTMHMFGGRDPSDFSGPTSRYWRESPDTFRRAMETRFRGESIFQEETKLVTLDGRVIDVLFTAARSGPSSDLRMTLIGMIDTTELVQAREMLQRVQADFAHAARVSMLGELTASIAHEVNQPLAAIATNGEAGLRWLDRPEPDVAEVRALTKRIVADARRAADILSRIRAMATRKTPEHAPLSIDEVIREALMFLRHEVQSHALMVTHHPVLGAPKVLADRTLLQQVIVNLAVNAMQAITHAECVERRISIRTAVLDGATLRCSVEDSGPGIKPEHLGHLFDSFFTTKDAGGGMGLGLAISRSIIEAHGGRISADNASVHGGARVSFILPAAAAAAA
jgi:PAS domain S-box-containing protein